MRSLLKSLLLLAAAAGARAEDAPPPQVPQAPKGPVETIEVRAEHDDEGTLDTTAFATIIRAADFSDRVTSVPELLRDAVGVQVRGLGGEYATVSIRGSSAEQVVVYLDGVPLNRALAGEVNLADLPLGQVDSIEVYRGFTPAGLPAASIGGAILIHTRRAEKGTSSTVSATAGSYGSFEGIASTSGRRGNGDWRVGLDGATGNGDFLYLDNNGTPHNPADDATVRRDNNDFQRGHLSGNATLPAGTRGKVTLTADLLASERGVPGIDCCKSPDARFSMTRGLFRPTLQVPGLAGGRLLARAAVDYTYYREQFEDKEGQIGLTGFPTDTNNRIDAVGIEGGFVLAAAGRQAISLLLSRRWETADLEDRALSGPTDLGHAERTSSVVTIEDQISFASDKLLINPSLRHEAYDSLFHPGAAGGLLLPPASDGYLNGKIGFRLRATNAFTVKGNFGRFARLPDIVELFGNQGSVQGNPALVPEQGQSFDLGFMSVARRPAGPLRSLRVEMTVFQTLADDLIQFVPNAQNTVRAQNLDRALIRGVELTLSLGLGPHFDGSLNVTHQDPRDASGGTNDGLFLPGRPRDEVTTSASFDIGRGRIFYEFTYVGANFIDTSNSPEWAIPARYIHDVGGRLRLRTGLMATLEVKNATDEWTYDYARFPLPGRSVQGKLSWEF